ncbi:hypothetical protein B0J13DRAFT_590781 [Dactylonectria estremocensis]|uniref:Uncharacterized protein n=1 Tax=Dactylonectria estremocensis TaxID=1079267 RepID=A0A9P9D697_9HYPO|nr:hypothetical protein B0J13DRAFT_590781 [Dactylonectria estremocensis]
METAGLVIGVAGLAGLFNSCLEAIDKVQSYQTFGTNSHVLDTRFKLLHNHHTALNNKDTSAVVTDVLYIIIKAICDVSNAPPRRTQAAAPGDGDLSGIHRPKPPYVMTSESRRRKITWALWGKGGRMEQVELFKKLVHELHSLVPPNTGERTRRAHKPDTGRTNTLAMGSTPGYAWPVEIQRIVAQIEGEIRGKVNGPAGFRKTILCARIIKHLSSILETPVAYFFFSPNYKSHEDPYLALQLWISQIVLRREDTFKHVRQRWKSDLDPVTTRANIITLFMQLLYVIPSCIFIANGLDECAHLNNSSTSVAKYLHDITDAIMPKDIQSNTSAYSQSIINRKLPNKSDDIRSTLSEAMADRCQGQFHWLKMQEESLRRGINKKQLQIARFREREKHRAFALLHWITEAALIVKSKDFPLEDLSDDVDNDYVDSEIISLCKPLVEVRNEPTDPLTPSRQGVLHDSPPPLGLSFRRYAATTWHQRLQSGLRNDAEIARLYIEFLNRDDPTWDAWRAFIDSGGAEREGKEAETIPPSPLYYAIKLHLTDVAISLITEEIVNKTSNLGRSALGIACANGYINVNGSTPLTAASGNGHIEVVKMLLEYGADMIVVNNNG